MRVLFSIGLLSLLLAACGAPTPQRNVVIDNIQEDTITTIDISNDSALVIEDEVQGTIIEVVDSFVHISGPNIDHSQNQKEDIREITVTFNEDGSVREFKVNPKKDIDWEPFTYLDSDRVIVNNGATLNLASRYYDVPISTLRRCNPNLKDPNHIEAGSILLIKCCNNCK